jgi:hypothetical protein
MFWFAAPSVRPGCGCCPRPTLGEKHVQNSCLPKLRDRDRSDEPVNPGVARVAGLGTARRHAATHR